MKQPSFLNGILFPMNVVLALALGYSILHGHLTGLVLAVIGLVVVVGLQVWMMRQNSSVTESVGKNVRAKK